MSFDASALKGQFEILGKVSMTDGGAAFAVDPMKCFGVKEITEWPEVDFEHAIFFDPATDQYVVARPGKGGEYGWPDTFKSMKRIR